MFVSHHTLKWTRTCRSHGRHPHAHTAHFLLNRHILTLSSASVIQETMWNPSNTRSASGQRSATHGSIQRAPSPVTTLVEARCSGVNAWKNRPNTSLPYPSRARITRCRSWSTTTARYVALPVAGPVHADRRQAVERRGHRRLDAFGDPTGDVSRGPPRDMKETADGLLARDAHQPRALRLEIPGGPTARPRPRHGGDRDAAPRAVHARQGGDQSDPPAAEVLVTPATHAAAPVVTMTASAASGASEHAPARARADLEHGHGAQWGVDDARVLDHHAFDVEKPVAYAVHQALCGCVFLSVENILPKKRSSLTPTTTQRRTHTHKNSNSAIYETKHEGPDIPQIGK